MLRIGKPETAHRLTTGARSARRKGASVPVAKGRSRQGLQPEVVLPTPVIRTNGRPAVKHSICRQEKSRSVCVVPVHMPQVLKERSQAAVLIHMFPVPAGTVTIMMAKLFVQQKSCTRKHVWLSAV